MDRSSKLQRYLSAFIFGFAVLFPTMNRGGVISFYEAIAGIWLLFLIPAILLYFRMKGTSGKPPALKITAVTYVIGASLYSFIEPVIAGYKLGYFIFVIPLLISLTLMIPAVFVRNRFYNARPRTDMVLNSTYTEFLRNTLSGSDPDVPEVFISSKHLTIGGNYVTHRRKKQENTDLPGDS